MAERGADGCMNPHADRHGDSSFLAYSYEHSQTVGSTGYYCCKTDPELDFQTALALFKARPQDDFLHASLLEKLLGYRAQEISTCAQNASAACASLILEALSIRPELAEELGEQIPALEAKAKNFPCPPLTALLMPEQISRNNLASSLGADCKRNIEKHHACIHPKTEIFEKIFPGMDSAEIFHRIAKQRSIFEKHHASLKNCEPVSPVTAKDTYSRAFDALSRAELLTGFEMRHEASLSPIALLHAWRVDLRVDCQGQSYSLRGEATAYGRGLSLSKARASWAMEIVERASAYVGIGRGGRYDAGQVLGRKEEMPLRRASFNEIAHESQVTAKLLCEAFPFFRIITQLAREKIYWLALFSPCGEKVWMPAQWVFLFCNLPEISLGFSPGSTGLASGNSLTDAKLAALLEIIERDADASSPFIPQDCFELQSSDPRIQGLLEDYRARKIHVQFQDIKSEFGVPVFRAFVTAKSGRHVAQASGAKLSAADAALAALTETPWPYPYSQSASQTSPSAEGIANLPKRLLEELPDYSLPDPAKALELLEKTLLDAGKMPLYLDLTRADLDIPVVRAFVPGLAPHTDFDAIHWPSPLFFARLQHSQACKG